MSTRLSSGQLADLRQDTQRLIAQAREHAAELEALVVAADRDAGPDAAAGHAAARGIGVQDLLAQQCQRSAAGAAAARRLWLGANQQHAAAGRLLTHLDDYEKADASSTNVVLVVDDYSDIRTILSHVLEDAGFVVRTAANGLEAVLAAYEMQSHVIVMDVSMPVLDGIDATRLIKAGDATRDARVIAYTGSPDFEASPSRTLFAAVLSKPATPEAVLQAVQRVASH
jgi:CheY-like chemotaxis protein